MGNAVQGKELVPPMSVVHLQGIVEPLLVCYHSKALLQWLTLLRLLQSS
jgi:hypothetical protein